MLQTIMGSIALMAASGTMDLPEGTVLCGSEQAAREYVEATEENDENRLHWLLGSACFNLPVPFDNQTILDSSSEFTKVQWSNGVFKKERFVVANF